MDNSFYLKKIISAYNKCSLLTKIHITIRYYTCPFLWIERYVPNKGIIIDYGCGHGIFSHMLSLKSPERVVYAFDISDKKMKEAKKSIRHADKIKFVERFDLSGLLTVADCVVILDVLSYLSGDERQELLRMLYKSLKPGSVLLIKDIDKASTLKYLLLFLQELIAVRVLGITKAHELNFFKKSCFYDFLQNAGFRVNTIDMSRGSLYPHTAFICKK